MRRRLLPLVFVCLAPAAAQQLATLYGRVLDPSDAGIQNASVAIVNEDTGFRRMLESDSEGSYSAGSLQPGSYKVTVISDEIMTSFNLSVHSIAADLRCYIK